MLTPKEAITNKFLLLYLIKKTKEKHAGLGKTKIQKLTFLSEINMIKNKVRGLNYSFYRWEHGAFSFDIQNELRTLVENEIIKVYETGWGFEITNTEKSNEILNLGKELIHENRNIICYIDNVIEKYANRSTDEIRKEAYSVKIPIIDLTVKEIDIGKLILSPLKEEDAKIKFKISDELVETLEIYFDTEFLNSLRKGIENVKLGKICRVESELLNV